ncbi:MAG: L,D-transpeptidase family protein [Robiginitomaculum sp.]
MTLIVNAHKCELIAGGVAYPCRIGRDGYIEGALGAEGDYKTPLGRYAFRYGFYRADRVATPPSDLQFYPLRKDDGWCDAPNDAAYNMPVALPYPASAERLWKQSGVYDMVIVLGHNDSPPVVGLGSAIFLHIAHYDDRPTAGCIAVSPDVMAAILPAIKPGGFIDIRAQLARAKYRAADPNMAGAEGGGDLKIGAHAHGQF